MKKAITLFLLLCSVCLALYAGDDIGDYSVSDITDSKCADFATYLEDEGIFENVNFYGIFCDDDVWEIRIADYSDFSSISIEFQDNSILIIRWANYDLSSYKLFDVLKAVNDANYCNSNFGTVGYSDSGDIFYACKLTHCISSEALYDQVDWVGYISGDVFPEVLSALE